jgi:hypothetical protein
LPALAEANIEIECDAAGEGNGGNDDNARAEAVKLLAVFATIADAVNGGGSHQQMMAGAMQTSAIVWISFELIAGLLNALISMTAEPTRRE